MPSRRKMTNAHYETLAAFRYALRRFIRFSEEAAEGAGLTPQQHQALLAIKGFPGREAITVGELAEWLQLRPHSAVGLIDRLVKDKLAVRSVSEQDRRSVLVELSARGEKLLEKLSCSHRDEIERIGPELKRLIETLDGRGG
jgi:DNA-binding MarR family transcriptional regulator